MAHRAALAEARELARVEAAAERAALAEALGARFEGEKGTRFFRSTLVQTLF